MAEVLNPGRYWMSVNSAAVIPGKFGPQVEIKARLMGEYLPDSPDPIALSTELVRTIWINIMRGKAPNTKAEWSLVARLLQSTFGAQLAESNQPQLDELAQLGEGHFAFVNLEGMQFDAVYSGKYWNLAGDGAQQTASQGLSADEILAMQRMAGADAPKPAPPKKTAPARTVAGGKR